MNTAQKTKKPNYNQIPRGKLVTLAHCPQEYSTKTGTKSTKSDFAPVAVQTNECAPLVSYAEDIISVSNPGSPV